MKPAVPVALAGLLVAGCAGWREQAPARATHAVPRPRAQVWQDALRVLTEERYRIRSADELRGVIVADRDYPPAMVPAYAADAAASVTDHWWDLQVTLIVAITPASDGTARAAVAARLTGRESPALTAERRRAPMTVPLRSNGALEALFLRRLGASDLPDLDHRRPALFR